MEIVAVRLLMNDPELGAEGDVIAVVEPVWADLVGRGVAEIIDAFVLHDERRNR